MQSYCDVVDRKDNKLLKVSKFKILEIEHVYQCDSV